MTAILQQLDNFYLTDEELENTPSRRVGIDAETERRLRFYGCDRIQRAVVLLGLPQVVAATAQTLLHRFYFKRDLRDWHIRVRVPSCSLPSCAAHDCSAPAVPRSLLLTIKDIVEALLR
jgi:cyclin L